MFSTLVEYCSPISRADDAAAAKSGDTVCEVSAAGVLDGSDAAGVAEDSVWAGFGSSGLESVSIAWGEVSVPEAD